jgi:hypothetical protein
MKDILDKIKYCGEDVILVYPFHAKDKVKYLKYFNEICVKCGYKITDVETHRVTFGKYDSEDIICKLTKIKGEPIRKTITKLSSTKMSKVLR